MPVPELLPRYSQWPRSMFNLFIGDVGEYLSHAAQNYDAASVLIDSTNFNSFLKKPNATGYTSVGDIENLTNFLNLCLAADSIFFVPPDHWSKIESRQWTESILLFVSQYTIVHNLNLIKNKHKFLSSIVDHLADSRKTDSSQLWAVGCSITHGVGVSEEESWKYHAAQSLKLEYSSLSCSSSSIVWQANQICQSDIRTGDIVFWGLTSHQRIDVITNNQSLLHLQQSRYTETPNLITQFPPDILTSTSLIYHNIVAIKSAYNFCKKIGAKLVILGLMYDWDSVYNLYNIPVFRQYLVWPNEYVDLGTDNQHPGPLQHKLFAKEFVSLYETLYNN